MPGQGLSAPDSRRGTGVGSSPRSLALLFASLASACAYPVLFIYFHNIKEAVFGEVFSPILVFLAVAVGSWLVFGGLSGTVAKGAFSALVFMLVFMNYSPIEGAIRTINPDWHSLQIAPALLFLLVNLALALGVFIKGPEGNANISKITMSVGLAFLALIVFNAAGGIYTLTRARQLNSQTAVPSTPRKEP